jgi:cysteine-rich repeat protein
MMKRLQWLRAGSCWLVVLSFYSSLLVNPALAYEERTHQDMTRLAVDIMRLVTFEKSAGTSTVVPAGETPLWTAPSSVAQAEWTAFLTAIRAGTLRLLAADAGLPDVGVCKVAGKKLHEIDVPGEDQGFTYEYLETFAKGNKACREEQATGVIFENLNQKFPHGKHAGSALGAHAASPDRYTKDWAAFVSPMNLGVHQVVHATIDRFTAGGLAAGLAPIFCAVRWFRKKSCTVDDLKDFGDRANRLPEIRGLIPISGGPSLNLPFITGLGHLMNYSPGSSTRYDDISGFHVLGSGWRGKMGLTDAALLAAGDLHGATIDPKLSEGVRNYEICDGTLLCKDKENIDGHPASVRRTDAAWRGIALTHQPFTPLDNLAFFGWQKAINPSFPKAMPATPKVQPKDLARPLHALGDIAAPQHLIGGLGWGHRPYENMIKDNWVEVQGLDGVPSRTPALPQPDPKAQYRAFRDTLERALRWRKFILAWRQSFKPAWALDIPVRDMISSMGARNYSFIAFGNEETFGDFKKRPSALQLPSSAWPYVNVVHANEGGKRNDDVIKSWLNNNKPQMEHLIRNAVGGIIAFLASAEESMAPSACGDGVVSDAEACDDGNTANGDGCGSTCTVVSGFSCSDKNTWPSTCVAVGCGNGAISAGEQCDDGNLNNSDGCGSTCRVESGFACQGAPSRCNLLALCGDGIVQPPEQCDPGMANSTLCTDECVQVGI